METIKDKIERLKTKAQFFKEDKKQIFLKDFNDTYYFCKIILLEENYLTIYNFKGKRAGENDKILWLDIKELEEYKEREELK